MSCFGFPSPSLKYVASAKRRLLQTTYKNCTVVKSAKLRQKRGEKRNGRRRKMIQRRPSTKFITGIVTFANARIWEPHVFDGCEFPVYTASILIPKSQIQTNEGMNIALNTALTNGQSLHRGKFGKAAKANLPLHDGDAEGMDEQFRGCWVINAASFTPPKIWDNTIMPITDSSLVQPGCKVRVSLTFFAYKGNGTHRTGIGCMLGNIQKAFTRNNYEVLPDIDFDKFAEEFTRIFLM